MNSLPNAVAAQIPVSVSGTWQRHLASKYLPQALVGHRASSRWGRTQGFPILYLGRPTDSVIVEAYRHLVDPVVDGPAIQNELVPRVLITAAVDVTHVLDLRTATSRVELGLTMAQIKSETNDKAAYAACQNIAAAAHQHGFHGLIAPAATGLGETLALFSDRLPAKEIPLRTGEVVLWNKLPEDPRRRKSHLKVVHPE